MLSRILLLTWLSSYIVLNARGSFIFDLFQTQKDRTTPGTETKSAVVSSRQDSNPQLQYGTDLSVGRSGGGSGWGWGGGGGWGWPSHGGHDQNMDLYSLLGGLSFASLLGATIIYLARRNTSGRRRRRRELEGHSFLDDDDEKMKGGMSMTDILSSISNYLDSPWWGKNNATNNKYEFKIK